MSEEEIKINGKLLKELKVSELKTACKERNQPCSGNKSALVRRLKIAIQLENLQQAARSSPAGGTLPNSDIADDSGENDYIKQYMENQRKLLQSSRFSSTSEADSEDDAVSHKSGAVVSPLVTRRSRRTTKESNDSSETEVPLKSDDQNPEVQATVKSTQEESEDAGSAAVEASEKRIEDAPGVGSGETHGIADALPAIQEESPEKQEDAVNENKTFNGGKQQEDAKDEGEQQQEKASSIDNKDQEVSQPDSGNSVKQPEFQTKEELQVVKEALEEKFAAKGYQEGEHKMPKQEPEVQEEEPVVKGGESSKAGTPGLDKESMEVDVTPREESLQEMQKEETVTEETVVDVDEIVNQEEELDYDENDATSQDKSEPATEKQEEEHHSPSQGRRLRLKKDKKERRSRSDSRKADAEKMEDVVEADVPAEKKDAASRKRRKSSTNDGAKSKDQKDTTPEPVERKVRKRIKRQSLDSKSKADRSQSSKGKGIEADIHISDAVEITSATDENIDELEEKPAEEEKVEPEPEPIIPLRRISINKRDSSDTSKPRKRKWGGRNSSSENVNISSDLIKNLIDVKPDDIRKAMDDQEEPGELVEELEEEVDEIIDITMDEPDQETESSELKSEKRAKHTRGGEEDGEIVEEEEVVVEELEEGESAGEDKPPSTTHHDNRKVVSGKNKAHSESRMETKGRKVLSRSDQKRSLKEENDTPQEKKKESSRKRSRTSVTVTNKSGPKEPTPPPEPREVSPSRYEPSTIVHVRNLVRPFTLNQLQGLLGKLGKVAEGSFWIDKIKSHCLVSYESVEDAVNARKCLHGINWPSSNPKQLSVDFCEQARADGIKGITTEKSIPPLMGDWRSDQKKSETEEKARKEENRARRSAPEDGKERQEERRHDRERRGKDDTRRKENQGSPRRSDRRRDNSRDKDHKRSPDRNRRDDERRGQRRDDRSQPLREWDRDKIDQDVEHRRIMRERERERRSPHREERREVRERRQKEEPKQDEQPAKLLDDLFHKTKAAPCIYWLPLTDEQVAKRLKEREERREARKKIRREMDEEEQRNRAKMAAERRERNARSPDRRRLSDRARRDSTGDRRPDRRLPPRHQARRSREKESPVRRKSPQSGSRKPQADSSSDSSSSDDSSGSESDSDSDSDSSSDSSPKKK